MTFSRAPNPDDTDTEPEELEAFDLDTDDIFTPADLGDFTND
jgi:hypothetical protein